MHGYQDKASEFLYENPFSALFVDVGLGKTIMTLTLLVRLFRERRIGSKRKTLIIAPIRVAAQTWPNEIPQWEHTLEAFGNNFTVIRAEDDDHDVREAGKAAAAAERERLGEYVKRRRPLAEKPDTSTLAGAVAALVDSISAATDARNVRMRRRRVSSASSKSRTAMKNEIKLRKMREPTAIHLINREAVKWLVDQYSTMEKQKRRKNPVRVISPHWPYKTVIIDESDGFKDHASARFQALAEVRLQGHIDRLHILTATPASESYLGLWAQFFLVDCGKRLSQYVSHFREQYFTTRDLGKSWKIRKHADEEISAKIADVTLVMESGDYLRRERGTELVRPIRLEKYQLDEYKRFERESVFDLPDGEFIEALSAGALHGKLVQLASGALYKPDGSTHIFHDQVLGDLEQLVSELNGSPILVTYWFESSLERLKTRFPAAVPMDKTGKMIDPWNAGKIKIGLIHPASAGHGLNMQLGPGHDIYHFDAIVSNGLFKQVNGRVDRQGQANPVRIHEPRVIGTAHDDVYGKLGRKEDSEQLLKKRITRIRSEQTAAELSGKV